MDKQRRGLMLADQEEAERNIAHIKKQLNDMGIILKDLGESIISAPENVIFSGAPDSLGTFTSDFLGTPAIDWNRIPQKEVIAQLIQELRKELSRLRTIRDRFHLS
jgi:hypothetical protein